MSLLRASRSIASSLRLTSTDRFIAERIIARIRLLLCAPSLWEVYLDAAGPPTRYGPSAYELLSRCSAFAVGLMALTCSRMQRPLAWISIHIIDIAAVSRLRILTGSFGSAFLALLP